MGYRLLVTSILTVHFAYLAYVVLGGFLTWRWPRAFWPHLAAAVWGLAVVGIPLTCPLTAAEGWARGRAGETAPVTGFIDRYIEGVLYPERYTVALQTVVGIMIITTWLGGFLLHHHRGQQERRNATVDTVSKSEVSSGPETTV